MKEQKIKNLATSVDKRCKHCPSAKYMIKQYGLPYITITNEQLDEKQQNNNNNNNNQNGDHEPLLPSCNAHTHINWSIIFWSFVNFDYIMVKWLQQRKGLCNSELLTYCLAITLTLLSFKLNFKLPKTTFNVWSDYSKEKDFVTQNC